MDSLITIIKESMPWRTWVTEMALCEQASSGSVGGRRIARSKSGRSRSGIDQLIGCRECSHRELAETSSNIVVPDHHLLNDSLSDSPSEPTVW